MNGAGVKSRGYPLDSFEFARLEERQDSGPIIGRTVGELQSGRLRSGKCSCILNRFPAQTGWRHSITSGKCIIEPSQAGEAARKCDFSYGQFGFGEELLGKQQ